MYYSKTNLFIYHLWHPKYEHLHDWHAETTIQEIEFKEKYRLKFRDFQYHIGKYGHQKNSS